MATYEIGQRIEAEYVTSVYKSGASGWRPEPVKAVLEVISPRRAMVVSASMKKAGSKRQYYDVQSAEKSEVGRTKYIASLRHIQDVRDDE